MSPRSSYCYWREACTGVVTVAPTSDISIITFAFVMTALLLDAARMPRTACLAPVVRLAALPEKELWRAAEATTFGVALPVKGRTTPCDAHTCSLVARLCYRWEGIVYVRALLKPTTQRMTIVAFL